MTLRGPAAAAESWTPRHVVLLLAGLALGIAVRAALLPAAEGTGDLDQFVAWTHGLATNPLGRAYDQDISFPPVMVYVWWSLTWIEPAFRTAVDASDPAIRALMKTPASLADIGLALGAVWALRTRPSWAVMAALGIALHPAVIDVSAWWGQYESLYVLAALVAFLFAVGDRPALAAVALAVAAMTKPQALPLLVPFAAWYLARYGWRRSVAYGAIGAAVIAVLWLPFLAAGGPAAYARNLAAYQNDIFAVLSLRAWNPWWLVQELFAGGDFVSDTTAIFGPVTFRVLGLVIAALLEGVVFLAVLRAPTPRGLALGAAAAALVAFSALTTMHERYAYAALVFLVLLIADPRVLATWVAFSVAFTLNLLAAAPPTETVDALLPASGPLAIAGSVALTAVTGSTLWLLLRERREWLARRAAEPAAEGDRVPVQVVG